MGVNNRYVNLVHRSISSDFTLEQGKNVNLSIKGSLFGTTGVKANEKISF